MLRFISPGDIFCFKISDNKFGFGRIISKVSLGHSAEIFDHFSNDPHISGESIADLRKPIFYLILDSYSLFDKKISGEWRIIGHQEETPLDSFEGIYFVYGAPGNYKKVDMLGNSCDIPDEKHNDYPPYTPKNNFHVINMLPL